MCSEYCVDCDVKTVGHFCKKCSRPICSWCWKQKKGMCDSCSEEREVITVGKGNMDDAYSGYNSD
jgi:hypothetical protein